MSSLVNVLMASQMLKVPKFVYISSHEVYEESYADTITEDMAPSPLSTKGMMVAQGENLVTRYGDTTQMDTYVFRLDHMYWMSQKPEGSGGGPRETLFGGAAESQSSRLRKTYLLVGLYR